jgi:hypothetical protein
MFHLAAAVFVESNKELLETIPPPKVALSYYLNQDLYLVSFLCMSGPVAVNKISQKGKVLISWCKIPEIRSLKTLHDIR